MTDSSLNEIYLEHSSKPSLQSCHTPVAHTIRKTMHLPHVDGDGSDSQTGACEPPPRGIPVIWRRYEEDERPVNVISMQGTTKLHANSCGKCDAVTSATCSGRDDDSDLLELREHLQRAVLSLRERRVEDVQGCTPIEEALGDGRVDVLVARLERSLVEHVSEVSRRVVAADVVVATRVDADDERELSVIKAIDARL